MGNDPRHPLVELTLTRLREYLREPEALFWSFLFPIVMTCAMGVAFGSRGDARFVVGVANVEGNTELSSVLDRDARFATSYIAVDGIDRALRDGVVSVVVVAGDPPSYRYDEARAESQAARLAVDAALQRAAGRVDAFAAIEQPVTVVGSRYIDWLVPGLLGLGIMGTGMWSIAFSIATARGRKLLKRFIATPMSRAHYLASFVLSRVVFLALEAIVLVAFAYVAFGVTVHGSLVTLGVVCLCGAITFGGLALLAASRAKTVEAVSGLLNFIMLPGWLLSGVFFAASNFPEPMQPLIQALPLTALVDALRAVTNDGRSLAAVSPDLAILGGWGAASFVLALKLFRWQ